MGRGRRTSTLRSSKSGPLILAGSREARRDAAALGPHVGYTGTKPLKALDETNRRRVCVANFTRRREVILPCPIPCNRPNVPVQALSVGVPRAMSDWNVTERKPLQGKGTQRRVKVEPPYLAVAATMRLLRSWIALIKTRHAWWVPVEKLDLSRT